MNAKQILNQLHDQMTETLCKTVAFKTEKSAPCPNAPFGKEIGDCLNFVLNLANEQGFDTFNCDGYAGHADMKGTGDQVLGILGHLDVVPAKKEDGWICPPYSPQVIDGKLYGRGTMDDKGPMIACLFAMIALKRSGFVPSKTIRLIFGCDEESGMECVEHYFAKMPYPDVSFSPDGDFPVINREKGIYHFNVNFGKINPEIVDIFAGERANVVADKCVVTLKNGSFTTLGKAAHGSTPSEGVNATWQAFAKLHELFPDDKAIAFVAEKMCDFTGKKWGIDLHDQPSGDLTCNIGIVRVIDGELVITVDVRFPVTYTCQQFESLVKKQTPFTVFGGHASEPLFVDENTYLVTTLMDVYNQQTESNAKPLAIGGGTYSRCLPNCVAFGPLFPKEEQTIHMPNENVLLSNLFKMADIYLEAIYRLAK